MARTSECPRESKRLQLLDHSCSMGASSDSKSYRTAEQTIFFDPLHNGSMTRESMESVRSTGDEIERSKSHWSLLTESDSDFVDEEVTSDNRAAFQTLQSHSTWGGFFLTFNNDAGIHYSGELEVREKFAEGGQAELFHAHVKWRNAEDNERDLEHGHEWVLKVFKQGTLLRHLQSQWPLGMFQYRMEQIENWNSPAPKRIPRFNCQVECGTLLEDGRFAFLLEREQVDLHNLIDRNMMMTTGENCGPFSREGAEEIMWTIALGMDWLHSNNIVHRDVKASNVLVQVLNHGHFQCFVADYECSIGVVGTGFFRAPEILEACKDKSVSKRPELFTKSSDVYSYGMTCYEILTGKLPFDGHPIYDLDLILNGGSLQVPQYVDDWIHGLLSKCWNVNLTSRPLFGEILNLILVNSVHIRKLADERVLFQLDEIDWTKWDVQREYN